ncbi:hypothetical protein EVAR_102374_1 [Eumeta japonica]|uniref:Uncharacterized protein n=1 Tax=Eumeta variegata TaxID=151549 RepID=A0A4C2AAJ1_EUMVA|nr:hypothetical protein EVAR_102374_1 [Eumeta japonica]
MWLTRPLKNWRFCVPGSASTSLYAEGKKSIDVTLLTMMCHATSRDRIPFVKIDTRKRAKIVQSTRFGSLTACALGSILSYTSRRKNPTSFILTTDRRTFRNETGLLQDFTSIRRALGCGRRALADPFGVPGPTSTRADRRSERYCIPRTYPSRFGGVRRPPGTRTLLYLLSRRTASSVRLWNLQPTVGCDLHLVTGPRGRTGPGRAGAGVTFGIVVARVGNFSLAVVVFPRPCRHDPPQKEIRESELFSLSKNLKIFVTKNASPPHRRRARRRQRRPRRESAARKSGGVKPVLEFRNEILYFRKYVKRIPSYRILFFSPPQEWMSDIWIRRRRLGSAQCSIAEAASARNISSNIFSCTAYCRGFITDERPRTNIGGK